MPNKEPKGKTIENKKRRKVRREYLAIRRAERRMDLTWTSPRTGIHRNATPVEIASRQDQTKRIRAKRKQRTYFAALSVPEKIAHREAGLPSRTVHPGQRKAHKS